MNLNKTFSFFLTFLTVHAIFAQVPGIEWQNTIGGDYNEYPGTIVQTLDGMYGIIGTSGSLISGDVTEHVGAFDTWMLKLNTEGNIIWQNALGGENDEGFYNTRMDMCYTTDSGYVFAATSNSNTSVDKSEDSFFNTYDYWIVKLDKYGEVVWENTIGGSSYDIVYSIKQTPDGGYIVGGESDSPLSGDKTEASMGLYDYWIIKLDAEGVIEWQNTIGGSNQDYFSNLDVTSDGGYILAGSSWSDISGDKTEDNGELYGDYWIVKLDAEGNIEWQNTIGGDNGDRPNAIKQTADGGYIISGESNSDISTDKSENNIGAVWYYNDYWIVKLDSYGNIEWENTIGGDADDQKCYIDITDDGNYIIGGTSVSPVSADKTEASMGDNDYWILKINALGNIIWQNTIGGYFDDVLTSIIQTNDGGYMIGGYSSSPASGDKTEDALNEDVYYYNDYWILKLYPDTCVVAYEICNGLDDDCNGIIDDSFIYETYYADADGDGFGNVLITDATCTGLPPAGYVSDSTDCNDANELIYPGAGEICNGFDDNCNVIIDEGIPEYVYYLDGDGDTFGDAASSVTVCTTVVPAGYVSDSTDCNDANAAVNPMAVEVCNSYDDDCDLLIDEGFSITVYFLDADADNFGNADSAIATCETIAPEGYVTDNTDCDDGNAFIHEPVLYYEDTDGDLYGDPASSVLLCESLMPKGYSLNDDDCDDTDFYINPGSNEICNQLDDNCNTFTDEDLALFTLYIDADNDNFGDASKDTISCYAEITGYISDSSDCNDSNPAIYPGALEIDDGIDNDCDKEIDEGFTAIQTFTYTGFNIYPNPNKGTFTVMFNKQQESINMLVYDLLGNKIFEQAFSNTDKIEITLPAYFKGIANLVLSSGINTTGTLLNILH